MLTKINIPVKPVAVGTKIKKLLVGTQSCSIQLPSRINGEKSGFRKLQFYLSTVATTLFYCQKFAET